MSGPRTGIALAAALAVAASACDRQATLAPDGEADGPAASASAVLDGNDGCTPTGTGLTAVAVNQDVVGQTVVIGDCDVGAFFDEDGVVRDAAFEQPDADPAPREQHLVRVEGADVEVRGSTFDVNPDYAHQIVHVGYRDGASGNVTGNRLTGFKRAGILLDGAGTSATVTGNEVIGVGEKSTGWAENGIQVSGGATATVKDNEIRDHWWNQNDFVSSGLIVFGSEDVTVQHNGFAGNDASVVLAGDGNNVLHNTVEATAPDGEKEGILHYGAIVLGTGNGLRQNDFTTETGADVGIYVQAGSANTKLIRNAFEGDFGLEIFDGGEETKLPDPFDPDA